LAGERGTFLALVLALVTLGVVERGRMRAVGWLVAAVVVAGFTTSLFFPRLGLAPELASRYSVEALANDQGTGRLGIWTVGLYLFRRSPFIGSGLRTFGPLYSGLISPLGHGLLAGRSPHNDLLGMAVDLGIVGALLYLAVVGWAIVRPLRARTTMRLSQPRVLPLLVSGLLIYWVGGGLTSEVFYLKSFWLLLGLSYAVSRVPHAETSTSSQWESSGRPTPDARASRPRTGELRP
jgi:O-antigen ligase